MVPTSMPGIGVRTRARILIKVSDGNAFPPGRPPRRPRGPRPGDPATRSSGFSIRGEQLSGRGNKQLKTGLLIRVRRSRRPRIADQQRQEDRPGQTPGPAPPRTTTCRRPLHHAPRRHLLRTPTRAINLNRLHAGRAHEPADLGKLSILVHEPEEGTQRRLARQVRRDRGIPPGRHRSR